VSDAGAQGPDRIMAGLLLPWLGLLLVGWLPLGLWLGWLAGALAALALAVAGGVWYLQRCWFRPLADLQESVARLARGEPGARVAFGGGGRLAPLTEAVASIGDELLDLYDDMDSRVARQTTRLAQKTASLKILYDAAAKINQADDISGLLLQFMQELALMINGRAATVRLCDEDRWQLLGAMGPGGHVFTALAMRPIPLCACGRALSPGDIVCYQDARECSQRNRRAMHSVGEMTEVEIPLIHHRQRMGEVRVAVEQPGLRDREDLQELLGSIGKHLGMAIAKHQSDVRARRLSILDERNHLAHELHDSLAQTLVSLRLQARMLQETMQEDPAGAAFLGDLARLAAVIDEAHGELRNLLANFRLPDCESGLREALQRHIEQFRHETGIQVMLQSDCREFQLNASERMQLLRIVQESLSNVRKHARAENVRVLLRCEGRRSLLLLIEDDGVGFQLEQRQGHPGEHIGLSIMEERARRIGASLRVESELDEGTRVELLFLPQAERVRTISGVAG
jgi:two-component system nitrate/nitrite sensor histidine kinase NarX